MIILLVASGLYVLQLLIVLRELSNNEYTSKLNVLVDLIPFAWLFFSIREGFVELGKIVFETAIDNFKKLKSK